MNNPSGFFILNPPHKIFLWKESKIYLKGSSENIVVFLNLKVKRIGGKLLMVFLFKSETNQDVVLSTPTHTQVQISFLVHCAVRDTDPSTPYI